MTQKIKKRAFVFAGGGSLGAIQVGMLKIMVENNIIPDICIGASAGALNAAYFASKPDLSGVEDLKQIWMNLKKEDIFPFGFKSIFNLVTKKDFLASPEKLFTLIKSKLPVANIEDTMIKTYIVTTNAISGSEVVLSSGCLSKALVASASIPAVFPPVEIDNLWLIDGGVASNTPVYSASKLGADEIFVFPTGFSCDLSRPPKGSIGIALHSLNLLIARNLDLDMGRASKTSSIRIVPGLCPLDVSPFDFSKTDELIKRAEESTRNWINQNGHKSQVFPHSLFIHSH